MTTASVAQYSPSPTLTAYAQGAARTAISPVAEFLAPTVNVTAQTGQYKKYDENHRFKIPDTRRAIGGRATQLEFGASDETYNCTPHAIDVPIDKVQSDEINLLENAMQTAMDDAAFVGGLAHERDVIEKSLSAVGAGTDYNFTSASVDPVKILDEAVLEISKSAKASSLLQVRMLFGTSAFLRYKNNAKVAEKKKSSQNLVNRINLDDVSGMVIGNPEVRMSMMVHDTAAEGLDPDIQFLLDNAIIVFIGSSNPTRRDPSFMKTFRLRNSWMAPRMYQRDDNRVDVAAIDWSEDVKVTNTLAALRINANAS